MWGPLLIFCCIQAIMQRPLLIPYCTLAIKPVASGQRPSIHSNTYLVHVIEIQQGFKLARERVWNWNGLPKRFFLSGGAMGSLIDPPLVRLLEKRNLHRGKGKFLLCLSWGYMYDLKGKNWENIKVSYARRDLCWFLRLETNLKSKSLMLKCMDGWLFFIITLL